MALMGYRYIHGNSSLSLPSSQFSLFLTASAPNRTTRHGQSTQREVGKLIVFQSHSVASSLALSLTRRVALDTGGASRPESFNLFSTPISNSQSPYVPTLTPCADHTYYTVYITLSLTLGYAVLRAHKEPLLLRHPHAVAIVTTRKISPNYSF